MLDRIKTILQSRKIKTDPRAVEEELRLKLPPYLDLKRISTDELVQKCLEAEQRVRGIYYKPAAERDEAREHSRKLVDRLREIRSFVKAHDGEEAKKLLKSANLEAFMDGLVYRVKGIPVSVPIVQEVEVLLKEVKYLEGLLERNEGRVKKIVDEGLINKIQGLEGKFATVVKLIEQEEWNSDFREVLLMALKD